MNNLETEVGKAIYDFRFTNYELRITNEVERGREVSKQSAGDPMSDTQSQMFNVRYQTPAPGNRWRIRGRSDQRHGAGDPGSAAGHPPVVAGSEVPW